MQQMTIDQLYLKACQSILTRVVVENPTYKELVGNTIYNFVLKNAGHLAPKVTGMIIDLPIDAL